MPVLYGFLKVSHRCRYISSHLIHTANRRKVLLVLHMKYLRLRTLTQIFLIAKPILSLCHIYSVPNNLYYMVKDTSPHIQNTNLSPPTPTHTPFH